MTPPVLQMSGIVKSYAGVHVLKGVNLEVRKGEILAVIGENGAGKSTLMKVLSGGTRMDAGEILMNGKKVHITDPIRARQLHIAMVQQELSLIRTLSIQDNLVLGNETRKKLLGQIDHDQDRRRAEESLRAIDLDLPVNTRVGDLPVAFQQMIEIARNLALNPRLLILDEPTTALTLPEVEHLFGKMLQLKEKGTAIIFISHKLEEVLRIADRVVVLRDGEEVANVRRQDVDRARLIRFMVGDKELHTGRQRTRAPDGPVCLRVERLTKAGMFHDMSFELHEGEILGLFGLKGAGRSELAMAIFGAIGFDSGRVELPSSLNARRSPRGSIDQGIGFLTEDRKTSGIFPHCSVRENISVVNMRKVSGRIGRVLKRVEKNSTAKYFRELAIKASSQEQKIRNLSGGNQQKAMIARWLFNDSRVLILDEPTKGVDVGAKEDIYEYIAKLAAGGRGILLISSDLEEIMAVSDRVLVMRGGNSVALLDHANATYETLMHHAAG